jgi:hypothetical protein
MFSISQALKNKITLFSDLNPKETVSIKNITVLEVN